MRNCLCLLFTCTTLLVSACSEASTPSLATPVSTTPPAANSTATVAPATSQPTRTTLIQGVDFKPLVQINLGSETEVQSAHWSPAGRWLAVIHGKNINVYDTTHFSLQQSHPAPGEVLALAFKPDETLIALIKNESALQAIELASGQVLLEVPVSPDTLVWASDIALSAAGQVLAYADDERITVWDIASGRELSEIAESGTKVVLDPSGQTVATATCCVSLQDRRPQIKAWSAVTGQLLHTLAGHEGDIADINFSADGRLIASAGGRGDGTVRLWDTTSGEQLHVLTGHTGWVRTVAFSPDNRLVASGAEDATLCLWDTATGELRQTLTPYQGLTWSIAFSPDGQQIVTTCACNNLVRV